MICCRDDIGCRTSCPCFYVISTRLFFASMDCNNIHNLSQVYMSNLLRVGLISESTQFGNELLH